MTRMICVGANRVFALPRQNANANRAMTSIAPTVVGQ
jgi:hypothetical protein